MMHLISNIVGRCHVFATNREVVIYVASRFHNWSELPYPLRFQYIRFSLDQHRENISRYLSVNGGLS